MQTSDVMARIKSNWKSLLGIAALSAIGIAYYLGLLDDAHAATVASVVGGWTGVTLAMPKVHVLQAETKTLLVHPAEPEHRGNGQVK